MSLYHFDLRCDVEPGSPAEFGLELPSPEEARKQAFEMIGELAKERLRASREIAVRIRDGSPEPLLTLTVLLREEGSLLLQPSGLARSASAA